MILRTIKKISSKDTKRIENIREKETCISSLNDYSLLLGQIKEGCEKANNFYKNSKLDKNEIESLLTRRLNVGRYQVCKNEFGDYGGGICYGQNNCNFGDAYFIIGLKTEIETAKPIVQDLNLLLGNSFAPELYSLLPFPTERNGTIKYIAKSFYNKRKIYEAVHNSFLLEKVWLEKTFGETFTKNLINLFSIDTKQVKAKKFNITKENDFRFVMKMDEKTNILGPEYKKIGFSGIMCPSPKNLSSIRINVFLGPNNTLVEEAKPIASMDDNEYPFSKYSAPRPGNVQFEDNSMLSKVLEKEETLNDFLVNLEQLTNFGYEIYKKMQTNILVGNI